MRWKFILQWFAASDTSARLTGKDSWYALLFSSMLTVEFAYMTVGDRVCRYQYFGNALFGS